ncbi:MAG: hypothetical protein ABI646_11040, partial [Acidobacteriota bacterium]
AAGEVAGLVDAAGLGLGDAGGLTSGVPLHADAPINVVVRMIQNPKCKIPNRDDLLIVLMFIVLVRAILKGDGVTGCKLAVLSAEAACISTPQFIPGDQCTVHPYNRLSATAAIYC